LSVSGAGLEPHSLCGEKDFKFLGVRPFPSGSEEGVNNFTPAGEVGVGRGSGLSLAYPELAESFPILLEICSREVEGFLMLNYTRLSDAVC
jgi:hypothetical protein